MIRDREDELARLHAEHAPQEESRQTNGHRSAVSPVLSDDEIIEICRNAKNSPKFERLFDHGDMSEYGGDQNRADEALVTILYYRTQDEEQIDRIFCRSALHKPEKWGKRADYRRRTIKFAREHTAEVWQPDDGARLSQNGHKDIRSSAPREGVADERILRFKTAKELAEETPAVTEWVARPWVARDAITEVDGKIKAGGKTTWVTYMVRKVLDGEPFMGESTTKTRAVFLTEQPPASFRKALERADLLEREDLLILHWHDTRGVTWPAVAQAAVDKATECEAGALFVDTLGQFAGIRGDGENNAGAAQEAMRPLQEAAARGLAVVLTRHERKGGGEVGESGRGSSAFGGAVDVIVSIRRGEGNTRPTVRIIESLSRFDETPDKLVVELTDGGYKSLGDATAFAEREAREAILDVLPAKEENAIKTDDLLDKLKEQDIKRTVATDALANLANSGTVRRIGAGKKGNPYRYYRPLRNDEKDSSEPPAGSGRMNTGDLLSSSKGPVPVDQIHSSGTSTLGADERKDERERFTL